MKHSILQLIDKCKSLTSLKSVHARLLIDGSINSFNLALNKLLRLYSKFGCVDDARKVFDGIPQPNSFLWTALIHGYVDNHHFGEAFNLFSQMRYASVEPLSFTIASTAKGLAREKRLRDGESLFGFILKCGYDSDLIAMNAMLEVFMRCGSVNFARLLFDEMEERDVVSWNTMIAGYANNDRVEAARAVFDDAPVKNAISWTSMIGGYAKAGDMVEAKVLFDHMPTKDSRSYNVMFSGYCTAGHVQLAEEFLDQLPEKNVLSWAMMVDVYAKAGDINSARSLFDQMPEKNLIAWSTMIKCYARNGEPRKALELYRCFNEEGIKPDETFILSIITACSQLGILDIAESMVQNYLGDSLFSNLQIATSLIDMYAKCGNIEKARQVFGTISRRDLLCYSTMIQALANHGLSQDAISLFDEMQKINMKPDSVAFLGVLGACNHSGLVNEGRKYFKQMMDRYEITPSERHYACMVDLLGRAGCLDEAYGIICSMPMTPNAAVWGALLAASRVHRNVQLGEVAALELLRLEPDNSGNYILLSNLYAAAGRWDGVARVRAMIREHGVRKNRASSWIELGSEVYEFVMGDLSHSDSETIYFVLELLNDDMKLLGYETEHGRESIHSSRTYTNVHFGCIELKY